MINYYDYLYVYVNVSILLHFQMFEFASVGVELVRFTLTKVTGVTENYMVW